MKMKVDVKKIIWSILLVVLMAIVYYFTIPAVNLRNAGFLAYVLFVFVVIALIVYIWVYENVPYGSKLKYVWAPALLVVLIIIIGGISSWNLFHAKAAREVAQVTEVETFEEGFSDLLGSEATLNNLPIVDYDTAKLLGDKKVAGIKNSTWYEVDKEYNLIKYQGKYYRLSVIDYGGV